MYFSAPFFSGQRETDRGKKGNASPGIFFHLFVVLFRPLTLGVRNHLCLGRDLGGRGHEWVVGLVGELRRKGHESVGGLVEGLGGKGH